MLTTTARIQRILRKQYTTGVTIISRPEDCMINFTFDIHSASNPLEFENQIEQLKKSLSEFSGLSYPKNRKQRLVSLPELEQEFKLLNHHKKPLTEKEKRVTEEYNLFMMKTLLNALQKWNDHKKKKAVVIAKAEYKPSLWRIASFLFLAVFNVLFMAMGGFLGMQKMLTGMFGQALSKLALYLLSGMLSAVECLFCYSMMASFLKKGLGIPENNSRTLSNVYDEQFHTIERINKILMDPRYYMKNRIVFENNAKIAILFNNHLASIKIERIKENTLKICIRWIALGINTLLTITNGYFMVSALIKAFAAGLLGTPIGWSLIISIMIFNLISNQVMRHQSLDEMLNPSIKEMNSIKATMNAFESTNPQFQQISKIKKRLTVPPTQNQKIEHAIGNVRFYRQARFGTFINSQRLSPSYSHRLLKKDRAISSNDQGPTMQKRGMGTSLC